MPYETDAQHFDPATLRRLRHQGARMQNALHGSPPPDRKEAARIQIIVDGILDGRPRKHTVAPDGEIVWEGAVSPFVFDQAATVAVNATDRPEHILPHGMIGSLEDPPEPEPLRGGGVGVVDREEPKLNYYEEQAIKRFREQLDKKTEGEK